MPVTSTRRRWFNLESTREIEILANENQFAFVSLLRFASYAQLDDVVSVLIGNKYIVTFDITMDNALLMQHHQSLQQLLDESSNMLVDIQRRRRPMTVNIGFIGIQRWTRRMAVCTGFIVSIRVLVTVASFRLRTALPNLLEKLLDRGQTILHADIDRALGRIERTKLSSLLVDDMAAYFVLFDAEITHDVRMIDRHDHLDLFGRVAKFLGIVLRQRASGDR